MARLRLSRMAGSGAEIFESIQGEGPHVGRPSIFIRTSGCNLQCTWCDTPYTWNWVDTDFVHRLPEKYQRTEEQIELGPEDIVDRVRAFRSEAFELTGGEPLTQQSEWPAVLQALRQARPRATFDVETNGTIAPRPELDAFIDTYVVSPKLDNAGMPQRKVLRYDALRAFCRSRTWLKIVVRSDADVEQVRRLQDHLGVESARIYLMPEGTSPDQLAMRSAAVAEACIAHGYRFADRLHVRLFANRRGT